MVLSPPPSPLPNSSCKESYFSHPKVSLQKQAVGRRYTVVVTLVPLLLVFATMSCRFPLLMADWNSRKLHHPSSSSHDHVDILALNRRQTASVPVFTNPLDGASTTTKSPSSTMISSTASTGSMRDTVVPPVPTDPTSATRLLPTPFPSAFDTSLSLNFSSGSCQNLFVNFTQSTDFRRCRPFSFLLNTSNQFIQAQSNLTLLTDIIWGTCNTVTAEVDCQTEMNNLAQQLQTDCQTELKQNNALVNQALTGFQMFGPMRQAGCLIDEVKGAYCFAEAVANKSPADLYFYQLPYGNQLPNGTVPSCSTCIKSVLAVYAQAVTTPSGKLAATSNADTINLSNATLSSKASNIASVPLDQTYGPAAQIAIQQCGSVYAQQVNVSAATNTAFPVFSYIALLLCFLHWVSLLV